MSEGSHNRSGPLPKCGRRNEAVPGALPNIVAQAQRLVAPGVAERGAR